MEMSARWMGCLCLLLVVPAVAQEQVDKADVAKQAAASLSKLSVRARVINCVPEAKAVRIDWRRGGEGLGGEVVRGGFAPVVDVKVDPSLPVDLPQIPAPIRLGEWSAWLPLQTVVGRSMRWEFPTITVSFVATGRKNQPPPESIKIELEFAESGKPFKRIAEESPKGATIGFAFPGGLLDDKGAANAAFLAGLQGLSSHARARYETLKKAVGETVAAPKLFAILGHVGGYGEFSDTGRNTASGYGVRHCNPQILIDEFRTLELLGMNGLVGAESFHLAKVAGVEKRFDRMLWGGPGAGSPMAAVSSRGAAEPDGCPFDPQLKASMAQSIARAIAEHQSVAATERWGLWWDEIGVAVKSHMNDCPRCRDAFAGYLRGQKVTPQDVGAASWEEVKPAPLFIMQKDGAKSKQVGAPVPTDRAGKLRYYYTHRFMTHATGQLFPGSAEAMKQAGIRLYAMQGPTPSWSGHSLDWHEFYDTKANHAFVWETSNRDPRVWQMESYLADIGRCITERHAMPMGCLVKPHRGAPPQRMLTAVARGTRVVEWYTYGPDYAKGDSFSQSPQLLQQVAEAGRFLAKTEDWLYEAKWLHPAEVAFVSPRSSEIWSKQSPLGITCFENAKWVYLALRHAHIPLDILSEQQLAEGALVRYKVLYVPGTHLRRDAAEKIAGWVKQGGVLWTDCTGLSRDEADEPLAALHDVLGMKDREAESWGKTPEYRATSLQPLVENDVPASATMTWKSDGAWGEGKLQAVVGREALASSGTTVIGRFADDKPAVIERRFGKGRVVMTGLWAGLTYSTRVRRADYDMSTDFASDVRNLIAGAALEAGVLRPAIASSPLVETVALDLKGKRSIALINWSYAHSSTAGAGHGAVLNALENITIELRGINPPRGVRSVHHGLLAVEKTEQGVRVVLPRLNTIDLLMLEQ